MQFQHKVKKSLKSSVLKIKKLPFIYRDVFLLFTPFFVLAVLKEKQKHFLTSSLCVHLAEVIKTLLTEQWWLWLKYTYGQADHEQLCVYGQADHELLVYRQADHELHVHRQADQGLHWSRKQKQLPLKAETFAA